MIETQTPSNTTPLTRAEKLAILDANASPLIILERLWHAERRQSPMLRLHQIAGFGTTQSRARRTLDDLRASDFVDKTPDSDQWFLTKAGQVHLSRLWQEQIEAERRLRAAAFEGWTQGQLFTDDKTP